MLEGWPPSPAYVPPCALGQPRSAVGRGQWLEPGAGQPPVGNQGSLPLGRGGLAHKPTGSLIFTTWPGAELQQLGVSKGVSRVARTLLMPTESSVWLGELPGGGGIKNGGALCWMGAS